MSESLVLEMRDITKRFPGVVALSSVSFNLKKQEIHALIGENGAGKSTLMKILGGVYSPDEGEIVLQGETTLFQNPRDAIAKSISVIYQEFNLVPTLSVAENIFLGKEVISKDHISLNRKEMETEAQQVMATLGLPDFDCSAWVRNLSVAQQQLVEIAKAIFNESKILVMDEPTAVLSPNETELLFNLMRELRDSGLSIIYISHRLSEIIELSDRITVLRDGQFVTELDNSKHNVTENSLVRYMVGRDLKDTYPIRDHVTFGQTMLEVKEISKKGMFSHVSFSLRQGEILGFSGLVGAGRTEVMKAIFGAYPIDEGTILIDGNEVNIRNIGDAITHRIALIPEDRKREGLVLVLSMAENSVLSSLKAVQRFGILIKRLLLSVVKKYTTELSIRPALPHRKIKHFSGGNQQKVVLAKWLANNPRIVILDEPTRGIDVGAKVEIYKLINELAEQGMGIIFISSEQLEVLGMCDRIIVMHNGTISGEFNRGEATEENLLAAASGLAIS
ncbi:MAG: sugar ABC transporter ATP-binding protein [Sphaerochaetaceae bacterium]|jgi:ribose transport system ATP-binding protein